MSSIPSSNEFVELSTDVKNLLMEERQKVDVGFYEAYGSLVKLKSEVKKIIIVGDIHGDYESLRTILSRAVNGATLVFLGDYVDRGPQSPLVVYEIFRLKLRNPGSVVLLRGNHEGPPELPVYPHDFPLHLRYLYGDSWKRVYDSIVDCFNSLYVCAILEGSLFMVHGGVPTKTTSLGSLINAHRNLELLEELLWNDPMLDLGIKPSPRGAGYLFGPDVTNNFLKSIGVKVVVRSHEPCDDGYRVMHNGKLITIFSRRGPPYFNVHAAYLDIEDPKNVVNAHQLVTNYLKVF